MYHVRSSKVTCASVDPTSQFRMSAMLLFPLAGNYKLRIWVALQCHGVSSTLR
jgi:hypothetical protein